jgi:hypothetical protein
MWIRWIWIRNTDSHLKKREEDTASWARLSRRLWERLSEVRRPKNMWIRWLRFRNTDSHLEKWGGGHCQLGEAVQEVVGEADRGEAAQKHVDPDGSGSGSATLILTWRSGEEDTASWARLSRRLWERLSEVRWPREARHWEERAVRRLWARESTSRD